MDLKTYIVKLEFEPWAHKPGLSLHIFLASPQEEWV